MKLKKLKKMEKRIAWLPGHFAAPHTCAAPQRLRRERKAETEKETQEKLKRNFKREKRS